MTTINWQQPYVNTFKHFTIASDRNVIKHGDISTAVDGQIKSSVYRIMGTTATSNFINMPKMSGQSLGLTGRYIYFLFKPMPNKCFSLHVDINTEEKTTIRISFSNLFKEFKKTSTWLQFPYVIAAPKGSVYEKAEQNVRDLSGAAPPITRWTVFCVDLISLTQTYANRKFQCVRGYKLCANLQIKNVVTSDSLYEPGVTHTEAKLRGNSAIPRELSFPCDKYESWHNFYDYLLFPDVQYKNFPDPIGTSRIITNISEYRHNPALKRQSSNGKVTGHTNNSQQGSYVQPHLSQQQQHAEPKKYSNKFKNGQAGVFRLPLVGVTDTGDEPFVGPEECQKQNQADIHIYPSKSNHGARPASPRNTDDFLLPDEIIEGFELCSVLPKGQEPKNSLSCLEPDPILRLRKLIGFGAKSKNNQEAFNNLIWSQDSQYLVYSCQAVVVAYHVNTSDQWCFVGHADKVSCLAMNASNTIVASGQTGQFSLVRLWDFQTRKCLAIFRNHDHSLNLLEFSSCSNYLCGVGKDKQGKTMLIIWDLRDVKSSANSDLTSSNSIKIVAKAHTDVHITKVLFVHYDSSRLITCGRENVRFWRMKDDTLRSCAVNLSPYIQALNMNFPSSDEYDSNNVTPKVFLEFTDLCVNANSETNDNLVYACTRTGQIFEFNIAKMEIENVRVLEPLIKKKKTGIIKSQQTLISPALQLNSLTVSDQFCATGSEDGFVRIWPLDFAQVSVEAEHEAAIGMCRFSPDFFRIATSTASGNLGILDLKQKEYVTLIRSHTDAILDACFDPACKYIATTSRDLTVRVWNYKTSRQLYDFSAPNEAPTRISFHPKAPTDKHETEPKSSFFACGFSSGRIRIFNVNEAKLVRELPSVHASTAKQSNLQDMGKCEISDLKYSSDGRRLISGDLLKYICLYDVDRDYCMLRMLPNCISTPGSLSVSFDDKTFAVIGSSDYILTVFESATLNEVLRIDITTTTNQQQAFNETNGFNARGMDNETAVKLAHAPYDLGQLVCVTSANRLIKFDAKNGRVVSVTPRIHKNSTDCLSVTNDGRYLVTSGDNLIKVWDYEMRLEKSFQSFIGHSSAVSSILLTPDNSTVVSVGDSIIYWDFLAYSTFEQKEAMNKQMLKGRALENMRDQPVAIIRETKETVKSKYAPNMLKNVTDISQVKVLNENQYKNREPMRDNPHTQNGAKKSALASKSLSALKGADNRASSEEMMMLTSLKSSTSNSAIHWSSNVSFEKPRTPPVAAEIQVEMIAVNGEIEDTFLNDDFTLLESNSSINSNQVPKRNFINLPNFISNHTNGEEDESEEPKTQSRLIKKHLSIRKKKSTIARRKYLAPADKRGLQLNAIIGYNGKYANKNMTWSPEREFFAFTCGTVVCIEDLKSGKQTLLCEHQEDVTVLTLRNDCIQMASASGMPQKSEYKDKNSKQSQITIWDCDSNKICVKLYHKNSSVITALSFSQDDRFLISIGDYRTPSLTVWGTYDYTCLVSMDNLNYGIHDVAWNPSRCNEFALCGQNKMLVVWTLEENKGNKNCSLRSFECEIPLAICEQKDDFDLTTLVYSEDHLLYVATNFGLVTVWDTKTNTCFLNWQADRHEIDSLVSINHRLVTGSCNGNLKLWDVSTIHQMKETKNKTSLRLDGLTIDNEISLNGAIKYCKFDAACEIGIVATNKNTLWYVNWTENTSVRLMSTHSQKINSVQYVSEKYLSTASDDGSLCIWSLLDRERVVQFEVKPAATCQTLIESNASTCKLMKNLFKHASKQVGQQASPLVVVGYFDGSVRVFDIDRKCIASKIKPLNTEITAINYCHNSSAIVVGSVEGTLAVVDLSTGLTMRLIHDHKGAPITGLDSVYDETKKLTYWLAASHDRRFSVWSTKWSESLFQMVDWLTFPAPYLEECNQQQANVAIDVANAWKQCSKSLAQFAPISSKNPGIDTIIVSYGYKRELLIYNFVRKQLVRSMNLTEWPESLNIAPHSNLIAYGTSSRLLQIKDYSQATFQDYAEHSDTVSSVCFSNDGKQLFSAAFNEIFIWDVLV